MSSVGSSGNHIMLGGGIGEWLYLHALGLRVHVRRRAPAGEDSEGSASLRGAACLRELGFGIDLRATHGLAARDACLLARVLRRLRARRASGEAPAGELVEFSRLRDAVLAERSAAAAEGAWEGGAAEAGDDDAARAAAPSARLVIDEHVARVLRSAHGTVATPRGPLAAKWRLSSEAALTVEVDVPAGLPLDVYVPLALLRDGGRGSTGWGVTVTREGELAPHWQAAVDCASAEAGGACVVGDESKRSDGGGEVAWAWALRGEANDRAPRRHADGDAAAAEHLRVRVPRGRFSVHVGK